MAGTRYHRYDADGLVLPARDPAVPLARTTSSVADGCLLGRLGLPSYEGAQPTPRPELPAAPFGVLAHWPHAEHGAPEPAEATARAAGGGAALASAERGAPSPGSTPRAVPMPLVALLCAALLYVFFARRQRRRQGGGRPGLRGGGARIERERGAAPGWGDGHAHAV